MHPVSRQCESCVHYHGVSGEGDDDLVVDGGRQTCEAFPQGIPEEIAVEAWDHAKAHPNDGGVQYKVPEGQRRLRLDAETLELNRQLLAGR